MATNFNTLKLENEQIVDTQKNLLNPAIKILLVDDREDNLFSIQMALDRADYSFSTATSGNEALKILLSEHDFTMILMDVEMPGINGFETAALIYEREYLKHIPIIFITANNYNEDFVFQGYQAGAVDYIYKPINAQLLRAKVEVFVEIYRKNHLLLEQEQKLKEINNELEERVNTRTQELLKKNEELRKVNNDLDNFVYTASHDLKAPVSNLEGLFDALKTTFTPETSENPDRIQILEMIDKSISRFRGTIADLAEISKIQNCFDDDLEDIDCAEIIENVRSNISRMIEEAGAKIEVKINYCEKIRFSKKNFQSIIYNVLSNAIKYRSPERASIISMVVDKEEDFVVLTVKDNGLGMKESSKIFLMFKRLHDHVEGSGVGLYLVKRMMDNVGGKVEVESKLGEGTIFRLYFKD